MFVENLPKRDPCLENVGQKTRPYGRHIPVPLICYVPPPPRVDSISHEAIFRAMRNQGIDEVYINMIKDACINSTAQIQTDVLS